MGYHSTQLQLLGEKKVNRQETVDEYLKRGGKITQIEYCACDKESKKRLKKALKKLKHDSDFASIGGSGVVSSS